MLVNEDRAAFLCGVRNIYPPVNMADKSKKEIYLPVHDLHEEPFDIETIEKLSIYKEYVRGFLPVFLNTPNMVQKKIQVFDFFAGPGRDINGVLGSPLLTRAAVDEALGHCQNSITPHLRLFFNEYNKAKHQMLSKCLEGIEQYRDIVEVQTCCKDFHEAFEEQYPTMIGNANLVFLDQNGVKQITESVFQRIVLLPKTDLLFFISSAMVNRFKRLKEIKQYVPLAQTDYINMNGTNVHRIVANAYRRWVPADHEYFLGSFSIRKGANVYGLIFGSGHPYGIEKFLQVVWKKHDGDANFDIDDDRIDSSKPSLFEEFNRSKKLKDFEQRLIVQVQTRQITTNKQAYIFALNNGFLGKHAKEALQNMVKAGILPMQTFSVSYGAWEKPEARPILM
jgi:three-Cys-motif partner protein